MGKARPSAESRHFQATHGHIRCKSELPKSEYLWADREEAQVAKCGYWQVQWWCQCDDFVPGRTWHPRRACHLYIDGVFPPQIVL